MKVPHALFIFVITLFSTNVLSSTAQDSQLLVNMLLQIDSEKYITQNINGDLAYNDLAEYQDWERLYINSSNYNNANKSLSKPQLKRLLFLAFIAKTNNDASLSESLSSDLLPIYQANKTQFLQILNELDFLIPASCYYLGNYFGFEDKHKTELPVFIAQNKTQFQTQLGFKQAGMCLKFIDENKYK